MLTLREKPAAAAAETPHCTPTTNLFLHTRTLQDLVTQTMFQSVLEALLLIVLSFFGWWGKVGFFFFLFGDTSGLSNIFSFKKKQAAARNGYICSWVSDWSLLEFLLNLNEDLWLSKSQTMWNGTWSWQHTSRNANCNRRICRLCSEVLLEPKLLLELKPDPKIAAQVYCRLFFFFAPCWFFFLLCFD